MRIKAVCDQDRESAYEQGQGWAGGAVCPLSQWTPCLASPDMTLPAFPSPRHVPATWVTKVTSPEIVGVLAAEA